MTLLHMTQIHSCCSTGLPSAYPSTTKSGICGKVFNFLFSLNFSCFKFSTFSSKVEILDICNTFSDFNFSKFNLVLDKVLFNSSFISSNSLFLLAISSSIFGNKFSYCVSFNFNMGIN